jgi:nucleoside-diphosphate-sugar epimerase
MTRVLVTGATGFVGRVLCGVLAQAGCSVRAAVRAKEIPSDVVDDSVVVGDINESTDWSAALLGVDSIVHAAARAHFLRDAPENAALYYQTNCAGTRGLLSAAKTAGVARLVYVSTIKVNGESTEAEPFTAEDAPRPVDDYARSKLAAEEAILASVDANEIDACIVRPPLVYGAGVRANFLRIMRWIDRGIPLPLGSVRNARSMVSVWNLCDLLALLARRESHAKGPRKFLVSDGCDLSTGDLVRRLATAMNRQPRLLPVPIALLRAGASLLGRQEEVSRLIGSLQVDLSATREALGWKPPLSLDQGLARTARWYFEAKREL